MPSSRDLPPLNKSFARLFLHNQFFTTPVYPPKGTSLTSQTAIVTGGNTGLGLESARQLLALHLSHLIIAVRTPSKGETAAAELRKQDPKASIEVWTLDMASYDSVQAFTRRVDAELPRLDIVILNAGIASNNFRTVAATGHEEIIQVNYLSTVLLATLLLPILKAKKELNAGTMKEPPRMTIVNSGLAMVAGFKNRNAQPLLPSFDEKKNFSPTDTYSTSKTLGHLWMWHAAEYISADDVVSGQDEDASEATQYSPGEAEGLPAEHQAHHPIALTSRTSTLSPSIHPRRPPPNTSPPRPSP